MLNFKTILNLLLNTRDDTSRFNQSDIQGNRCMALLSYIWLGCLVPIFCAKNSPYALYHARQGLFLAILESLALLVLHLLGFIPLLGIVFDIAYYIVLVAAVALSVIGIINCLNNRAKELPFMSMLLKLLNSVLTKN